MLNVATRLIFSARRWEHISPLLRELHWLWVTETVRFRLCVLAFRCIHGTAPSYLAGSLRPHRRCWRSANNLKHSFFIQLSALTIFRVCTHSAICHATLHKVAPAELSKDVWLLLKVQNYITPVIHTTQFTQNNKTLKHATHKSREKTDKKLPCQSSLGITRQPQGLTTKMTVNQYMCFCIARASATY